MGPTSAPVAAVASPGHGVAVAGVAGGCPSLPTDAAWSWLLCCSSAVPSSRFGPSFPLFLPRDLPMLAEAASPSLWTTIYVQMNCLPVLDKTASCPYLFGTVCSSSGNFRRFL
ncbi:hypothetical protein BDA96_01G227700 [Sorghum bicolor]|uniref:Uncharacterized protein n=1 Tax=Sorghum bicolor TaxID=4558 RepID=A0A921UZ04_SORBI|nr:hypothetical protein BDA96_01G227700 [Sorghum bicolor]